MDLIFFGSKRVIIKKKEKKNTRENDVTHSYQSMTHHEQGQQKNQKQFVSLFVIRLEQTRIPRFPKKLPRQPETEEKTCIKLTGLPLLNFSKSPQTSVYI